MEHSDIPAGEMHAPHNWRVADEAARLALSPTAGDLGKYLWQQSDDTEWFLVAVEPAVWRQHVGPKGDAGAPGDPGAAGLSAYEVALSEGFEGNEAEWLASLQGAPGGPGSPGADGHEVEFQKSATHIQWRYEGDSTWVDLVPLADLTGPAGAGGDNGQNIELQKSATHIQWRVAGTTTWTNLVALTELQGPAGSDATVNATNVAAVIHGTAVKTVPAETDEIPLSDSAASWALKRIPLASLKTWIKSWLLSAMPVGCLWMWPTSTPPTGWLKRNGAAISRTDYPDLFALLGTTYGAGNGSTTFNLPDDRGLFERGLDEGRGLDAGRSLGSYQATAMPDHAHDLPLEDPGGSGWAWVPTVAQAGAGLLRTRGAGAGGESRPPNRAYLPIIKALP